MDESPKISGQSRDDPAEGLKERVSRLENQVEMLIEAMEVLTRGLEEGPLAEPGEDRAERAARRTHELALLARTAPGATTRPGE